MGQSVGKRRGAGITIPAIGDRVERRRSGVAQRGTVHYADQLQILVKWDDGSSSSLRVDRDAFRNLGSAEKSNPPAAESKRMTHR
jgi:hypothetical protein